MKKLVLFCCFVAYGRDPFNYEPGYHRFVCISMGSVLDRYQDRCIVAQIVLDGITYTVKQGDRVANYTVVALSHEGVTLKDDRGNLLFLELRIKKGPSTCVS